MPKIEPQIFQPEIIDSLKLNSLPIAVTYILEKQFENLPDTANKTDFLKKRLREIFPTHSLSEIFASLDNEQKSFSRKNNKIFIQQGEISTRKILEKPEICSVQNLHLSEAEKQLFDTLNFLINTDEIVEIKKLKNIIFHDTIMNVKLPIFTDSLPEMLGEMGNFKILPLGVGAEILQRIFLARLRAEVATKFYFREFVNGGVSDAFKHILVNTLLKSYTNEFLTYLVMDVYWEGIGGNFPCDKIMDLHNNQIGRKFRYEQFCVGDDDWRKAALKVYKFVTDSLKNGEKKIWSNETPTIQVEAQERQTAKSRYIFWNLNNGENQRN